jgi:superfamily II DNA/RNA helicase
VLALLTFTKQICNHPAQYLGETGPLPKRSGKLARTTEMLEEAVAAGDKALVFTQFREMGDKLVDHLSANLGCEVVFLHGGTPKKARDEMVRRFQEEPHGPRIFVLSVKAGGTGLNLTAASHVFHFDRWWNPAVEDQATDRAYRIGQKRAVQVHKLVCAGTVEEKIDRLLEQKRDLAAKVVGAGEQWITELDGGELRDLFALSEGAVADGDDDDDRASAPVRPRAKAPLGARPRRGAPMSRFGWYRPRRRSRRRARHPHRRRPAPRGGASAGSRRSRTSWAATPGGSRAGGPTRAPGARTTSSSRAARSRPRSRARGPRRTRSRSSSPSSARRPGSRRSTAWPRRRSSRPSCSPGRCRRPSTRSSWRRA